MVCVGADGMHPACGHATWPCSFSCVSHEIKPASHEKMHLCLQRAAHVYLDHKQMFLGLLRLEDFNDDPVAQVTGVLD